MQKDVYLRLLALLRPPGDGVFTVSTHQDLKAKLHSFLYGETSQQKVLDIWKNKISNQLKSANLALIGASSDCGGGIQRGANWGPLFIRMHWLLKNKSLYDNLICDLGDIPVIPHLLADKYLNEATINSCRDALYSEYSGYKNLSNLPVSPLSILEYLSDLFYKNFPDKKMVVLGGDHSISYPLVKSLLRINKLKGIRVAVIHFDAHTDLLDKRIGIDLNFGSWAYHILEDLCDPSALVQLGIRATSKDRDQWENNLGVKQYWAQEINKPDTDISIIANSVLTHLESLDIDAIYFSVDIDVIDISQVSATGTPEQGGLDVTQVCELISRIGDKYNVLGADLVEVAPMVRCINNMLNDNEPESTLDCAVSILNELVGVMV